MVWKQPQRQLLLVLGIDVRRGEVCDGEQLRGEPAKDKRRTRPLGQKSRHIERRRGRSRACFGVAAEDAGVVGGRCGDRIVWEQARREAWA